MIEQTVILDPYEWAQASQVGKARDASAGWRVPLWYRRDQLRLTDGWLDGNRYIDPFLDSAVQAAMKGKDS